ncbi:MAG: hypothetical protein AB7S26_29740 [Sandaracinaceae bacterium]
MSPRRLAPILALAVALAPAPAAALDSPLLTVARGALEEGDPGRALELARISRLTEPGTSTDALVVMGRSLLALDRPEAAHRLLRRALDGEPSEAARAEALALLARANRTVAFAAIEVDPVDAVVTVDGERAEWERGQRIVLVTEGTHTIQARAPGHAPRTLTTRFFGGVRTPVHLHLPPGDPDDEPRPQRLPPDETPLGPWFAANMVETGFGVAGAMAAGAWLADASGRADTDLGARLELEYAHYELGLALGLAVSSQGFLQLQDTLVDGDEPWLTLALGAGAMTLLAIGAATATWWTGSPGDASPTAFSSGALFGAAIGVASNTALRLTRVPWLSIGIGGVGMFLSQFPVFSAYGGRRSWVDPDGERPDAQDACEDLQAPLCQERRGLARVGDIGFWSGLGALGLSGLAMGVGVITELGGSHDVSIAASPGGATVSGRF